MVGVPCDTVGSIAMEEGGDAGVRFQVLKVPIEGLPRLHSVWLQETEVVLHFDPGHGHKDSSIFHSANLEGIVGEVNDYPTNGPALGLVHRHCKCKIKGERFVDVYLRKRRDGISGEECVFFCL